jgi:hypothetical protein
VRGKLTLFHVFILSTKVLFYIFYNLNIQSPYQFFMSEEDYKAIIATYQQKSFELFNQNIVLETQVNSYKQKVDLLTSELDKLNNSKARKPKVEENENFK